MEEWKPVPGYEEWYEVSSEGRVRTVSRIVPQHKAGGPYFKVSISRRECRRGDNVEDIRRQFEVHVLVAAAFLGPRPFKLVVDHVNNSKEDNRAANLEYVSRSENAKRAWKLSKMSKPPMFRGEQHWKCKVPNHARRSLVWDVLVEGKKIAQAAREYNVNKGNAWTIIRDARIAIAKLKPAVDINQPELNGALLHG